MSRVVAAATHRSVDSSRARCGWTRPWCRWRSISPPIRVSCGMPCACLIGCCGRRRPTPTRTRRRTHLVRFLPRLAQVIDQTTRRVCHGEAVPADEKLLSLFEVHTDVLVTDRRDTCYGRKIFLTTGRSGLMLDCAIPTGNPADLTWTVTLVRRQCRLSGRAPRHASVVGAFAS